MSPRKTSLRQYGIWLIVQGFVGDFGYCGKLGVVDTRLRRRASGMHVHSFLKTAFLERPEYSDP